MKRQSPRRLLRPRRPRSRPSWATEPTASSMSSARRIRPRGSGCAKRQLAGLRLLSGGAAPLPAGLAGVSGARLRRRRQPRPCRARALARPSLSPAGPEREQNGQERTRARSIDTIQSQASGTAATSTSTLDHTIQARRADGAEADDRAVAREERDGGHARPAHRRRARDGLRRPGFRECLRSRSGIRSSATARSRTPTSRGRRSSSSRSPARSRSNLVDAVRRASCCRTRSTSPTGSSTMPSLAGPRR